MEAAIVALVRAADKWGHLHYLTGRASLESVDVAWKKLNVANIELCAVAAQIQKADKAASRDDE